MREWCSFSFRSRANGMEIQWLSMRTKCLSHVLRIPCHGCLTSGFIISLMKNRQTWEEKSKQPSSDESWYTACHDCHLRSRGIVSALHQEGFKCCFISLTCWSSCYLSWKLFDCRAWTPESCMQSIEGKIPGMIVGIVIMCVVDDVLNFLCFLNTTDTISSTRNNE